MRTKELGRSRRENSRKAAVFDHDVIFRAGDRVYIRTLAGARCQGDNSGELTASTAANSFDQSLSPNSSESSALMSIIANYTSHTSRRRHAADVCRYVHVYRKLKCNAVTVAQYAPMPLIYVQKKR